MIAALRGISHDKKPHLNMLHAPCPMPDQNPQTQDRLITTTPPPPSTSPHPHHSSSIILIHHHILTPSLHTPSRIPSSIQYHHPTIILPSPSPLPHHSLHPPSPYPRSYLPYIIQISQRHQYPVSNETRERVSNYSPHHPQIPPFYLVASAPSPITSSPGRRRVPNGGVARTLVFEGGGEGSEDCGGRSRGEFWSMVGRGFWMEGS